MLCFEPITIDKQKEYRSLLTQVPDVTSDYSFINLWSWQEIYELQWAWWKDLVFIRQNRPQTAYWAPIGNWLEQDWVQVIADLNLGRCHFDRIPEQLYSTWDQWFPGHQLTTNRDHWDYVYSIQELISLRGKAFHKKKNLLNQFLKKYDFQYQPLGAKNLEQALTLQTEWCLWRDCEDSTTLEAENQAIVRTLQEWELLEHVFGGGLLVKGQMVAFTVAEPLDKETIVIHFEKGCPNYKGVYQAINQIFLQETFSVQGLERCAQQGLDLRAYKWVNREQDLGDPGLRKAKESYNPVSHLKKYQGTLIPS